MDQVRPNARIELMREAERLFGNHGVEAVTLRDITRAAGHRNELAVHYHFGSKTNLVDAVVAERLKHIETRRLVMLKQLEADGAARDPHRLWAAIVEPLVDEVVNAPGGEDYIRFLAQAITRPGFDIVDHIARLNLPGMMGVTRLLRALAKDVAPPVQHMRERMAVIAMVTGLAGWVALPRRLNRKRMTAELIEAGVALLVPRARQARGN